MRIGGGGGVGIQGVQLAKIMGFRPIAVDTGAAKRRLCLEMGAEEFIDFKEVEDAAAAVVKITDGKGAHGVIVTAPQAYASAISYLGRRVKGIVVCVGMRKSAGLSTTALLTKLCSGGKNDDNRSRSIAFRPHRPYNQGVIGWEHARHRCSAELRPARSSEAGL